MNQPSSQPVPAGTSKTTPTLALVRVIDASANRAREALRVIEDFVRFVLDDAYLTEQCKSLRHGLQAALTGFELSDRLAARETQGDVGTSIVVAEQVARTSTDEVLHANFSRLQEALRSLEEFSKIDNSVTASSLEQLRYRCYTLQRAVHATACNAARLADRCLYVLIDGRSSEAEFCQLASTLIAAGADILQLRDKRLDDRTLAARARTLVKLAEATGTIVIVNDRPDIAAVANAHGVHVGQEELTVKDARTVVGPRRLVGVSTHSIQQARQAVDDGADYLGVGPVFPSGTKQFDVFPGLDLVAAVAAEIRLPAFAIGGITGENISQVTSRGLRRVAVSGAVANAAAPGKAVQQLRAVLSDPS